jgi:NAD(P)-dependent dehydrogenase (short-subunit alcohol dehydrogenase family)
VQRFGHVDGVVINHGIVAPKKLADSSLDDFRRVYEVNTFSHLEIAKAALTELRKSKGSIIWISSGAVNLSFAAWAAYASSKSAVNIISTHLAVEEPDITTVSVEPGLLDTDLQAAIRSEGKGSMDQAQHDFFVEAHKSGQLLKPEQPGAVIAALVANPSKELSGKVLSWDSPELVKYQT